MYKKKTARYLLRLAIFLCLSLKFPPTRIKLLDRDVHCFPPKIPSRDCTFKTFNKIRVSTDSFFIKKKIPEIYVC